MTRACRVLVVEDDADLASSLRDVLREEGYGVEVARNGQGALKACRRKEFDLALVDIRLPDAEGVELVERLAEITSAMEYVIMTGWPTVESAVASVTQKRIVGYETKPLDLNHLTSLMKQVVARRKAEDTARASVRRWQAALDGVSEAVCVTDLKGRILQINRAMTELVGRLPGEVIGASCRELVRGATGWPQDCPLLRMQESHSREMSLLSMDDRWFEVSVDPLVDESGVLTGAVHVMRDVTSRKRAEEAVLRERDLVQRYLDVAGVMLVALDAGGTVTMGNRKACEILGCGEDEVMGKNWFETFVPERLRKDVRRVFDRLMAGEIAPGESYENAVLTWGGEERLIAWHNTVVWDEGGQIAGTLSSGEDIGELRRVEDEVRLKAQLLDAAKDSIFLRDFSGALLYANESAWRSRGYTRDEFMAMTLDDLCGAEAGKRVRRWISAVLKRGEAVFESSHLCKDGSRMPVEVRSRMVESEGRKLILSVARDISVRKRTQEELEAANRRLERAVEGTTLAFEMAIEMRDPYTSGHQRRTTRLACAIAEEMRLPKTKVQALRAAGAIHDVGKLYIPSEILSKPGHLTEAEFSIIREHPKAGYDILKVADADTPVADIVLQHHERIDGSGYPCGLSGDGILLEARILAVADVVEAMSSHRPYRPAHPADRALVEIMQKKGILYDCDAVDACMTLFTQKGYCFEPIPAWQSRPDTVPGYIQMAPVAVSPREDRPRGRGRRQGGLRHSN